MATQTGSKFADWKMRGTAERIRRMVKRRVAGRVRRMERQHGEIATRAFAKVFARTLRWQRPEVVRVGHEQTHTQVLWTQVHESLVEYTTHLNVVVVGSPEDTVKNALKFVLWYRRMCIEGQIKPTDYANMKRPCSDFQLMQDLERLKIALDRGTISFEAKGD